MLIWKKFEAIFEGVGIQNVL